MDKAEKYKKKLKLLARETAAWAPIHSAYTQKIEFLIEGKHYNDDSELSLDSMDIRWVGEEAFHRYRHEIGAVTEPGTLTARAADMHGDTELGDYAVRLVLADMENPAKETEDTWEDFVGSAIAGGYGVVWIDHLPDEGHWGEILLTADDPRNFMCDRRVKSVHSPRCRFVIRRVRMTIGEAKRRANSKKGGWNKSVVERLRPDDGCDPYFLQSIAGLTEETSKTFRLGEGDTLPTADDDEEFTAYIIWERNSDETEVEYDREIFDEDDRYMRCATCGYRSPTQEELGVELPEVELNGCPECEKSTDINRTGDLHRIDALEAEHSITAYPDGYVCVVAPAALTGEGDFLYEGPWPYRVRSYPCAFIARFRHPYKIMGPSIADLAWWNQVGVDMLMRMVLERMVSSSPAWLLPADGLEDARGDRYEMSDENGWKAFYTGDAPPRVEMIGGETGIPTAWSAIYSHARNALTGHTGLADFGLSESASRNIPAASVALQVKQEEIPVAHFKRRYQRTRGMVASIYWDMMRDVYPTERIYRILGEDANDAVVNAIAADLPNFDFYFDASPDLQPQDEATAKAMELLITTMETRPWAVDLIVTTNKISQTLVKKARKKKAEWDEEQRRLMLEQEAAKNQKGMPPVDATAQNSDPTPSRMVEDLIANMNMPGGGQ